MSLIRTLITKELIEKLDKDFPDMIPRGEITIETLRFLQGQRNIIEYIRSVYNEERNINPED